MTCHQQDVLLKDIYSIMMPSFYLLLLFLGEGVAGPVYCFILVCERATLRVYLPI